MEGSMNLWDLFSSTFRNSIGPLPERRLDGRSDTLLTASMKMLPPEERGWITIKEAAALFSSKGGDYAFGELDETGKQNLSSFVTMAGCQAEFMPVEGRIYFVRRSN
jgi:hypothetical protein